MTYHRGMQVASEHPLGMEEGLHAQVRARSVLALLLGGALVVFAHSPWVTVPSGVAFLLLADGALGLLLHRRIAGWANHPQGAWLLSLWGFNVGLSLLALLAVTLGRAPLAPVVIALVAAVTTGFWLMALSQSAPWVRRALLTWAALLFVSAAALPVVWTLQLTPWDVWSPRLLGVVKVLLGLLMLVFLRRSR